MTLDSLIGAKEAKLTILGVDGSPFVGADGEPWTITIAGPTHAKGFAAEETMRLRALKLLEGKGETSEEYIDRVLEPLILRTIAWSPITLAGQPFPCTPENVKRVYRESDFVRKQVEGFVYKTSNFLNPQ